MKCNFSAWAGLSAAIWLVAVDPALAEPTRDAVMDAAQRCEGIPDNRVWLDCFYGSAQPMRAALGLAPAPESQTRLVPRARCMPMAGQSPARARARRCGKSPAELSRARSSATPSRLADNMPMTAYGFGRDGKFTVTMADGHVWQQAESDIKIAKWNKPAASYKVTSTTVPRPISTTCGSGARSIRSPGSNRTLR